MAIYNNVPKNIKARTILKMGTEAEWAKANGFSPMVGEPIIWESCIKIGPGWYEDKGSYYHNGTDSESDRVITSASSPYCINGNQIVINNPETPYNSYPVDEKGYIYEDKIVTVNGITKSIRKYEITARRIKVGNREADDVMSDNLFIDTPEIKTDSDGYKRWYIGHMPQNVIAEPKLEIKDGIWWINGVSTGSSALGAPFTINRSFSSVAEMQEACAAGTDGVPIYGVVIINVPKEDDKNQPPDSSDVDNEETAELWIKQEDGVFHFLTDLSGAQGVRGPAPYIGSNDNWWIDNEDTGVSAYGEPGKLQLYIEQDAQDDGSYVIESGNVYKIYASQNSTGAFNCALYLTAWNLAEGAMGAEVELQINDFQPQSPYQEKNFILKILKFEYQHYPNAPIPEDTTPRAIIMYQINDEKIMTVVELLSAYIEPSSIQLCLKRATKVGILQDFINLDELKGDSYILTDADKQEIANTILEGLEQWQGGSF